MIRKELVRGIAKQFAQQQKEAAIEWAEKHDVTLDESMSAMLLTGVGLFLDHFGKEVTAQQLHDFADDLDAISGNKPKH